MTTIACNKVMLDYMTLTSFSQFLYDSATRFFKQAFTEVKKNVKRLQYIGEVYEFITGTAYLGRGRQRGELHYIVQVSGELSHHAFENWLKDFALQYDDTVWKCTRVDVQVTAQENEQIDWYKLAGFLRGKMGYVKWYEGETNTVSLGDRKTVTRFVRLYEKLLQDGGKLLRLEVEIKRRRADALMHGLVGVCDYDMSKASAELKFVLQKAFWSGSGNKVYNLFAETLENAGKVVRLSTHERNTEEWLMKTALPSIRKYLQSHSSDKTAVVAEMDSIMEEYHNDRRNE